MSQGRSTPWSLGMGNLQPLVANPYNGYINPYYWVDDHPLLYGSNGSLDPSTYLIENIRSSRKVAVPFCFVLPDLSFTTQ